MSEYFDTYFINPKRALKIAKQNNSIKLYNGYGAQLCYYSGEKIDKTPSNMLFLPIEDLKSFFKNNSYRMPEYIDFIDSIYENKEEDQEKFKNMLLNIFKEIKECQTTENTNLIHQIKQDIKAPMNTSCINFIIIVSKTLSDDYLYAKNIKISLEALGHTVNILTEKGSRKNILTHLKTYYIFTNILKIKPNVILFINDYKSDFITDDTYQVSIINGFIPLLKKLKDKELREKDMIFTQNNYVSEFLDNHHIKNTLIPPAISYKSLNAVNRESGLLIYNNYQDVNGYLILNEMVKKLFKYVKNTPLTIQKIKSELASSEYQNKNDYEMMIYMQTHIVLQTCINWFDTNIVEIKIFGFNWEKYKELPKNIKYSKTKPAEKLYKKVKYVLHISHSIVDNNLLAILKCGAIPLVYDLRDSIKNYDHRFDSYCLFFKTKHELDILLQNNIVPDLKNLDSLLKEYSFDKLAQDIVENIKKREESDKK